MIDMTARVERIMLEADNPKVAVLLLDVVSGLWCASQPGGSPRTGN